jgi:transcriptional regulator with XRE-family HTH domain
MKNDMLKGKTMNLQDFMRSKDMTDQQFANYIGVTRVAVTMYRNGDRIPKKEIMQNIRDFTKGKVQPNDFY